MCAVIATHGFQPNTGQLPLSFLLQFSLTQLFMFCHSFAQPANIFLHGSRIQGHPLAGKQFFNVQHFLNCVANEIVRANRPPLTESVDLLALFPHADEMEGFQLADYNAR